MKIELLWIDGCPSVQPMLESLESELRAEGIDAVIELVRVRDNADAVMKKFPGSPTVLIDGVDPFAETHQTSFGIQCRLYPTIEGLRPTPTREMLRAALRQAHRHSS
jgi:hypothetical protein